MSRIKICGLTRAEDVHLALDLGADMLGFIHVPKSPRFVTATRLAELLSLVSARAETVVVVQNAAPDLLDQLRADLFFDHFQFHGDEPPEALQRWRGYKVFHVKDQLPGPQQLAAYGQPFLLDTQVGENRGGTGQPFDWTVLPQVQGRYLVAGGLKPENVYQLVSRYQPWGLDVSSGIEISPGIKDPKQMTQFIEQARRGQ